MHDPPRNRNSLFALRLAQLEHRRTRSIGKVLGWPNNMYDQLVQRAWERASSLWALDDLYFCAPRGRRFVSCLMPQDFRFRIRASEHQLGGAVKLGASKNLTDSLFEVDDPELSHLLPAVCTGGGIVLFAVDAALPPYPFWHIFWPLQVDDERTIGVCAAKWRRWIRWAATLPATEIAPTPPGDLTANERRLWDYIAEALGSSASGAQARYVEMGDEKTWLVMRDTDLAQEIKLTVRQLRTARKGLIDRGAAERLPRRGDGAAWGIRIHADK